MLDVREVYEMVTRKKPSDPGALERQRTRQIRTMRNRKIGAFAVAAAIGLAAVVLVLATRPGGDTRTPANPVHTRAEDVATDFVEAYGAFDAEQAITYLADDADISELMTSVGAQGVEGTLEEFRLLISLMEAEGYQQMLDSCEETGSFSFGTNVRCTFDFHLLRSDEIGVGPFSGSAFDLTVRDGEIVGASMYFEVEEFSPQMWEPFSSWVSTAYPDDAAVMYQDASYGGVRLTEESIRLWERRTREYATFLSTAGAPTGGLSISRRVEGVPFSFRVPAAGWETFGTISINKSIVGPQDAEAIIFWTSFPDGDDIRPDDADPCADLLGSNAGPTAADLAAAVSTAAGTELVAGPSDVTVGGYPAKHVVVRVREDVGCDPGYFYTWQDMEWGALWPATGVGDTIRVWIVDVDGTRLFIEAETNEDADSDLEREIQQIVGSIRFD
jgi:hypothetical protein